MKKLLKNKIQTRRFYPIQEMKVTKKLLKINRLKNSVKKSRGIFCLPLYPELKVLSTLFAKKNKKIMVARGGVEPPTPVYEFCALTN